MVAKILAILALLILVSIAVVAVIVLGELPGRIAAKRGHPYVQAVRVAGWVGVFTLGIIWPLALIWAYTNQQRDRTARDTSEDADQIAKLTKRIAAIEETLSKHRGQS